MRHFQMNVVFLSGVHAWWTLTFLDYVMWLCLTATHFVWVWQLFFPCWHFIASFWHLCKICLLASLALILLFVALLPDWFILPFLKFIMSDTFCLTDTFCKPDTHLIHSYRTAVIFVIIYFFKFKFHLSLNEKKGRHWNGCGRTIHFRFTIHIQMLNLDPQYGFMSTQLTLKSGCTKSSYWSLD